MTRLERLQQAALREARLQEAAVEAYARELRRIWRAVGEQIRGLVREINQRPTRSTVIQLGRVLGMRSRVREAFRRAGFDEAALAALADPLDRLAEAAIASQRIAGTARTFGAGEVEAIEAWRSLRLADLLDVADNAARVVQRVALDGMLGLRPVARLVFDLVDALELSERQARTIYDTAVSVFSRHMEALASDGTPDEVFVYLGPIDEKTRPFCLRWAGRVLDRTEITALDNGQLPDVFVTGGGYNCRHLWKRVSVLDEEVRALAGTGKRVTWMQDKIRALVEAAA